MFDFLKKFTQDKKQTDSTHEADTLRALEETEATPENTSVTRGLFARLQDKLLHTRKVFSSTLADLFLGKKSIDSALFQELENLLLSADVGVHTTQLILKELTTTIERQHLKEAGPLYAHLQRILTNILKPAESPLLIPTDKKPFVILMVGVNGTGKTTTIGKLAHHFQTQGKQVLLAAGDTFRAAAIEQLTTWGHRNQVPVIAQHTGADSASVIFDAFQAAQARNKDILIADTAGRLHTQSTLMDELKKIKRILAKLDPTAPHEVMLVLDASIGQNALLQAQKFHEAIGITGLTLTKLDGTAKGGILFSIASQLNIPIRFIGVGEAMSDLRPFQATEFVEALFNQPLSEQ